MPFSPFGDPVYGLLDARVGRWLNTAGVISYPDQQDVMSVQLMSSAIEVATAELTGDDRITATASRQVSGTINVRFAGNLIEVLEIVTGQAAVASGTTPAQMEHLRIVGGARMPYFGIIGQGMAEEGLGDMLVFAPKCKVTSGITLTNMEYNTWQIAEFTVQAVDDEEWGIINIVRRETTGTYTMPPAGLVAL